MKKVITLLIGFFFIMMLFFNIIIAQGSDNQIKLFKGKKCNECHVISTLGIGKVEATQNYEEDDGWDEMGEEEAPEPPDLSGEGLKREAKWIKKYLKKREKIEGRKHKNRFEGSKEELELIVQWLTTLKTEIPKAETKK